MSKPTTRLESYSRVRGISKKETKKGRTETLRKKYKKVGSNSE